MSAGTAKLIGTDYQVIVDEATRLLTDPDARASMARSVNPYGDGCAAEQIAAVLKQHSI